MLLAAAGAVSACAALAGIDDYVIGECKGGSCAGGEGGVSPGEGGATTTTDASNALPADDSGVPCLGREPKGLRIGSPGNTFCIDRTEVTVAQYDLFLKSGVAIETQPPICAWNSSFDPQLVIEDGGSPPPGTHPVTRVDWCDALAYCTWAGKYLCGRVDKGKKVGPVSVETSFDYHSNQWLLACTAEARLRYPYGPVYVPSKCNVISFDAGAVLPVGAAAECSGGFAGLNDLIGNAWEWYDGPTQAASFEVDGGDGGPASDGVNIRGGAYTDDGAKADCLYEAPVPRNGAYPNVGFRCCSD